MAIRTLSSLEGAVERHAWVLLVRGFAAMVFGICAFVWPGLTFAGLILLYASYCAADGVVSLAGGVSSSFWQAIATGVISLAAGIVALAYPGAAGLALIYILAAWSIARGVFEVGLALEFRKVIEGEAQLVVAGLLSIAFGVLIAMNPGAGVVTVVWIVGGYAVVFGGLLIALALRIRQFLRINDATPDTRSFRHS